MLARAALSLLAIAVVGACVPSDPEPPVVVQRSGAEVVLSVDNEREPDGEFTLVEVIPNPSQVLAPSDRRSWRVVGIKATAVRRVTLGTTPPGWVEQIAWETPKPEEAGTVRVEFSDGREFLIDLPDQK